MIALVRLLTIPPEPGFHFIPRHDIVRIFPIIFQFTVQESLFGDKLLLAHDGILLLCLSRRKFFRKGKK